MHGLLPEERPGPIAALAPERSYYLTSTSKTLAPGLRIAYVAAPSAHGRPAHREPARHDLGGRAPHRGGGLGLDPRRDGRRAPRRAPAGGPRAAGDRRASGSPAPTFDASPRPTTCGCGCPSPGARDAFAAEARARGVLVTPAEAFAVGREPAPHAVRLCLGAARTREALGRGLDVVAGLLRAEDAAGSAVV